MKNNPLNLQIEWISDTTLAPYLSQFFYDCLYPYPEYISHSELQEGRALSPNQWSPNLLVTLKKSVINHLNNHSDTNGKGALATAKIGGEVVALMQISYGESPHCKFVIIEDLVVKPILRNTGIGNKFLNWLHDENKKIEYRLYFFRERSK